jgi:hypothetical protein
MQNLRNTALRFVAPVGVILAASTSYAVDPASISDLFGSADLTAVSSLVYVMGGAIVAIAVAFTGIKLVKRGLSRA